MTNSMHRREFLASMLATLAVPNSFFAAQRLKFRIRTITAGVSLVWKEAERLLEETASFLSSARATFQAQGYEVQTLRIATQPLPEYMDNWISTKGLAALTWLDELCEKQREVVARRFGLRGHETSTLEEVGREIGLTRERVRQIQVEALRRLRDILEKQGLDAYALFGAE